MSSLAKSVAARYAARLSITNPMFNWREIAKQMVLVEDHLFHAYKGCPDCIKKHLLTIEALAEEIPSLLVGQARSEGVTLPPDATKGAEGLAELARAWMERLLDGEDPASVASDIRVIRKGMLPVVADPRDQTARVASVFLARRDVHRHL